MRRTAGLALLVALGAALVLVVHGPPVRPRAPQGIGLLGVGPAGVRGLDVELGERRFGAERRGGGWAIDGAPASTATAAALDDLVGTLARLRAVDRFRGPDTDAFGLDRPRATITVRTRRRTRRLVLGAANAAGSALYARRDHDRRVLEVGVGLLSDLERVFYFRDVARGGAQRPESG
ncbi:MAG TPA: DUF4340 domain-containing protein [Candidatus Binatia bacterium]|nr:DUF4340 domain-containing protein [Candidatus Binatia bacterium]